MLLPTFPNHASSKSLQLARGFLPQRSACGRAATLPFIGTRANSAERHDGSYLCDAELYGRSREAGAWPLLARGTNATLIGRRRGRIRRDRLAPRQGFPSRKLRACWPLIMLCYRSPGRAYIDLCSVQLTAIRLGRRAELGWPVWRTQRKGPPTIAALNELIADDVVYCHSSARLDPKASLIGDILAGLIVYQCLIPSDVKAQDLGDAVVLTGLARTKLNYGGKAMDIGVRFTDVWAKRNGQWQMVAWQSTKSE